MKKALFSLLFSASITVNFEINDRCQPDVAHLSFVPPQSVKVLLVSLCGGITCWETFIESNEKRLGYSITCDQFTNEALNRPKTDQPTTK